MKFLFHVNWWCRALFHIAVDHGSVFFGKMTPQSICLLLNWLVLEAISFITQLCKFLTQGNLRKFVDTWIKRYIAMNIIKYRQISQKMHSHYNFIQNKPCHSIPLSINFLKCSHLSDTWFSLFFSSPYS